MKQPQETNIEYIDYMVVVHGIGAQRPNETILPVINRIAELRQRKTKHEKKAVVTLGMITSQTGLIKRNALTDRVSFSNCKPWSEFKETPATKPQAKSKKVKPFYGEPSHDGSNIRFVDMYWADVMESHYKSVNEPLKDWADSLIGRLEVRQKHGEMPPEEAWILPILYRLEETLTVVEALTSLKTPGISQEIFDKYLGDVQIYGEYLSIRGEAVYRFHRLFDKIEEWHKKDKNLDANYLEKDKVNPKIIRPRYTIVAHSLGTIMSLDALMYAHMRKDVLENKSHIPNVPFPNYQHDNEETLETTKDRETVAGKWIDNIDSFITLGSPIDKYLTLWWKNYEYLNRSYFFVKRESKINHFNYCDEQDPVGHSLDLINAKDSFKELFETREDLVYNRYTVPGAAHTKYWTDLNLFEHILNNTIDAPRNNSNENSIEPSKGTANEKSDREDSEAPTLEKQEKVEVPFLVKTKSFLPFEGGAYARVLFFSYFFFGIISIVFSTVTLFWTFSQEDGDFISITLGSLAFVLSAYIFFRFIKMMIWWRQVVKLKKKKGIADIEQQRSGATKFKLTLFSLIIVHYIGTVMFVPTLMEVKDKALPVISLQKLFFVGLVMIGVTFLVYIKFHIQQNVNANMKFKDTAMTWTGVYTIFLAVSILAYHIFLADFFQIYIHLGERFNLLLAVYLISATITWMYTYICFNTAKAYLTRISKKIKKEEIKQQMQEGLELA
jgi:hypothetical protein